jgi:hypothetical protein
MLVNCSTLWDKFMVNDHVSIKEHDQHAFDIQSNQQSHMKEHKITLKHARQARRTILLTKVYSIITCQQNSYTVISVSTPKGVRKLLDSTFILTLALLPHLHDWLSLYWQIYFVGLVGIELKFIWILSMNANHQTTNLDTSKMLITLVLSKFMEN